MAAGKYVRIIVVVLLLMVLVTVTVPAVSADPPGPQDCWGTVVSQRAAYYHDVGTHSAAQEEPRLGVGNLAALFGMSVGELAALLGDLDDFTGDDPAGVTSCPQ